MSQFDIIESEMRSLSHHVHAFLANPTETSKTCLHRSLSNVNDLVKDVDPEVLNELRPEAKNLGLLEPGIFKVAQDLNLCWRPFRVRKGIDFKKKKNLL